MATDRQIAANRLNAKKSTGPRTQSGRARSSQNAFVHGLSTGIFEGEIDPDVQALIDKIAGPAPSDVRARAAKNVARAYLTLDLIAELRRDAFQRFEVADSQSNCEQLRRIASLDRYERSMHTILNRAQSALYE
jgi:hypothetical protein